MDSLSHLPNQRLLDEVARAKGWFHARKVRAIWAQQLNVPQVVQSMEGPVTAEAGDYLCRGEKGEVWPQKADRLLAKYCATDEVDGEGWRKFQPQPDAQGVWAARVDYPFQVQAPWGKLTGKAGDYVVKHFEDGDVPYPEDIWIVDQTLFAATYARVD